MITKEQFVKYIEDYRKWLEYSRECYKIGLDFLNQDAVNFIESNYISMLEQLCDVKTYPINVYSDISYFIYELDFGKDWKPGCVTESDGTDVKLETIDDLWKLITENNKKEQEEQYE